MSLAARALREEKRSFDRAFRRLRSWLRLSFFLTFTIRRRLSHLFVSRGLGSFSLLAKRLELWQRERNYAQSPQSLPRPPTFSFGAKAQRFANKGKRWWRKRFCKRLMIRLAARSGLCCASFKLSILQLKKEKGKFEAKAQPSLEPPGPRPGSSP